MHYNLEYLISSGNSATEQVKKKEIIENICNEIFAELIVQGITRYSGSEAEGHAYAVNNEIKDNEIRKLNILYGV